MSNYYAPCFYRIDFVVSLSYIELPCSKKESPLALQNIHSKNSFPVATQFKSDFPSYNIFDSLLFYIPDDTSKAKFKFHRPSSDLFCFCFFLLNILKQGSPKTTKISKHEI